MSPEYSPHPPRRALVLGGGGARLSYQAGALKALESAGYRAWDAIAGVSAGGLVGAMVAQGGLDELERLAINTRAEDVHRGASRVGQAFRILAGKPALGDHRPLWDLIQKQIDPARIAQPDRVSVGIVEWETGAYRRIDAKHPHFLRAVWAGATMPGIWPPVPWGIGHAVDGGLVNMIPLADVLWSDPDEIVVIALRPDHDRSIAGPHGVLDTLGRTLELLTGEIARQDLGGPQFVNDLVAQAHRHAIQLWHPDRARYLVPYRLRVIRPAEDLGETLDFSEQTQMRRFDLGYQDAVRATAAWRTAA